VQVGDSRCYRLRDGALERMSQDQTMAQALVEQGALSPTDAEHSPLRNMLASALGGSEARPMTATTDIRWDDVMLMCTDGLTKHVSEAEIATELRATASAEATCHRLVDLALERGGTDNVTVVVSRLRPRRPSLA
jgi:protein phosphatase